MLLSVAPFSHLVLPLLAAFLNILGCRSCLAYESIEEVLNHAEPLREPSIQGTSLSVLNEGRAVRISRLTGPSNLEEFMRMFLSFLALLAEIEVNTSGTFVADTGEWILLATITGNAVMNDKARFSFVWLLVFCLPRYQSDDFRKNFRKSACDCLDHVHKDGLVGIKLNLWKLRRLFFFGGFIVRSIFRGF